MSKQPAMRGSGAEAAGDMSSSGSPALGPGQGNAWAVLDLPAHALGVLWAVGHGAGGHSPGCVS